MIQRNDDCKDGIRRAAEFSDCGRYRFSLLREWDRPIGEQWRSICFVLLNPSVADGMKDDPTARKCIFFAKLFGYNVLWIRNLFPYRATDPRELLKVDNPTGGRLGDVALAAAATCDLVVAGWGANVPYRRFEAAEALFDSTPVYCLKKTKHGHPHHPLYLPYTSRLQPFWNCRAAITCITESMNTYAALTPPAAVAKNNRRVVFEFDERSNDTIDELKSRGMRFVEIALCNPETGERRSLLLPAAVEGAEPTRSELDKLGSGKAEA